MSKDINKISVEDLYELMKTHKCTQADIDAYEARCKAREKEFQNNPGAHHRFDYDFKYGDCTNNKS